MDVSPNQLLPLERARVRNNQTDIIQDADTFGERSTARLEIERDRPKAERVIAPEHCWIKRVRLQVGSFVRLDGAVSRRCLSRSRSRGTKVKSCYIGEEGSLEYQEAKRQKYQRGSFASRSVRFKEIVTFGTAKAARHLEMLIRCNSSH